MQTVGRQMRGCAAKGLLLFALSWGSANALAGEHPRAVTFHTRDGGTIDADLYGKGSRGVVFAHGAIFNKESWVPLAQRMAAHGFRALAINFRGYGRSHGGSDPGAQDQDVLAAIRWLHAHGAKKVSVVGGSMGGGAAGQAATEVKPGEIDKLVLLSPMPINDPEQLKAASILYIGSRDEGLAPRIRAQYGRAPKPKKLILLPGRAHAQNIFATDEAQALSDAIVNFLVDRH
jgi:pimeloyl-ACP methyl ester carboxylesterase